jgi:C-terminal processing protease CtpA/Prc
MKLGILVLLFAVFYLIGCSEDSFLSDTDEIIDNSEVETISNKDNNQWIYNQMRHHYYWNTEMLDSSTLDFTVDPAKFFTTLLSEKDRFSWCEVNRDYKTRGVNPGSTVSFDSVYVFNNQKIGYAIYDQFDDNADIRSFAVRMKSAKISEMILDLRYNPGGYVSTCNELASFFVPTEHLGKLYQQQYYNKTITKEKAEKYHNNGVDSVYLKSGSWYEQWGLNLKRLIVLSTKNTASSSEALVVGLRPYMDVVIIGTQTCGKDVGSYTIVDNNYKYLLQPITFKYYNSKMESTPEEGLIPDVIVEDDKKTQRGNVDEALLKAALKYIEENPIN